jgi:ATP/ADP translocase
MTNWLKVVGVLPGSLLCSAVLLFLTNKYRFPIVFYSVCIFFGSYFIVNAWILYPLRRTFIIKFVLNRMLKIQADNFFSQLELGILGIFSQICLFTRKL